MGGRQRRGVDPAEGIGRGDVDALRGDDEDGVGFDVGERVDFVAFVDAEGAAAEEEEGDVGAERSGDFDQAVERDALFA